MKTKQMSNKEKIETKTYLLFLITGFIFVWLVSPIITHGNYHTEELCREYAYRSHEKEFAPERYARLKDMIDSFDWYNACINNVKNPVAK